MDFLFKLKIIKTILRLTKNDKQKNKRENPHSPSINKLSFPIDWSVSDAKGFNQTLQIVKHNTKQQEQNRRKKNEHDPLPFCIVFINAYAIKLIVIAPKIISNNNEFVLKLFCVMYFLCFVIFVCVITYIRYVMICLMLTN